MKKDEQRHKSNMTLLTLSFGRISKYVL